MRQRRWSNKVLGKAYEVGTGDVVVNPPITATQIKVNQLLAQYPGCLVAQVLVPTSTTGYSLGRPVALFNLPSRVRGDVYRKAGTKNRFVVKRKPRHISGDSDGEDPVETSKSVEPHASGLSRWAAAVCIQRAFRAHLTSKNDISEVESSVSLTSYLSTDARLDSTQLQRRMDTLMQTYLQQSVVKDIINGKLEITGQIPDCDVLPGTCAICNRTRLISHALVRHGEEVTCGRECAAKVSAIAHAVKCMVYVHRTCEKAQRAQDYAEEVCTGINNRYTH